MAKKKTKRHSLFNAESISLKKTNELTRPEGIYLGLYPAPDESLGIVGPISFGRGDTETDCAMSLPDFETMTSTKSRMIGILNEMSKNNIEGLSLSDITAAQELMVSPLTWDNMIEASKNSEAIRWNIILALSEAVMSSTGYLMTTKENNNRLNKILYTLPTTSAKTRKSLMYELSEMILSASRGIHPEKGAPAEMNRVENVLGLDIDDESL